MEKNNNGSGIFLGVIGVATLIVAIIGATFAFFSANTSGGEDVLIVSSAKLALGFEDDDGDYLKTNLIPAEHWIAKYAAMEQPTEAAAEEGYDGNYQCIDDNDNEICGVYTFKIGNPSTTTRQTLYATMKVVANDFKDLYFRIYDENKNEVVEPTLIPAKDGVVNLDGLTQTLLASTKDTTIAENAVPSDYTLVTETIKNDDGEDVTAYNVRTYTMIIWIEENKSDQTLNNSGKTFTGSLNFTTANNTQGVTGVITAAQKGDNGDAPPADPEGSSAGTATDESTS